LPLWVGNIARREKKTFEIKKGSSTGKNKKDFGVNQLPPM